MNWNIEQYEAHQRRHGFTEAIAESKPVVPPPSMAHKADVRAEKAIHALIVSELHRRGIPFVHAPMHKRSPLPEGWPDFSVFVPGGHAWFAEIKTPEGRTSLEQNRCHAALDAAGFRVYIPRSFEQFMDALRREEVASTNNTNPHPAQ